jgi:hypothetical protein
MVALVVVPIPVRSRLKNGNAHMRRFQTLRFQDGFSGGATKPLLHRAGKK